MSGGPNLAGPRVTLRPFEAPDISERYLAWLCDPEVNRFSRRLDQPPTTAEDARRYLESLAPEERVLAIRVADWGHVGNVKYGPIDRWNRRAEISILVGERAVWGKGIGAEAVYLVTKYLFEEEDLHRVDAGSCNPAFIRMVKKLGWHAEGVLRERVWIGGRFHDSTLLSLLRREFRPDPRYEG